VDWAEIYLRTKVVKWYLDPSSSLATTDMGRKVGGAVPLFTGVGSPSNNVAWAETYLRINWHLASCSRLATIQGPKLGGAAVPPFWGERRYLVNTTEPSVCGGDAALCQITLTTCWNNCPTFGLVHTYRLLNPYVSRTRYTSLAQTGHQYKLPRL